MKKANGLLIFVMLLLLLSSSLAIADQEIIENKGIIDAAFYKGSMLSVTDPAYGMFYNPAVFARIGETKVSGYRSGLYASGSSFAQDMFEIFASAAQARDEFGWGIGLHYQNISKDAFSDLDESEDIKDFRSFPHLDYSEIGATFSVGRKLFTWLYVDEKGNERKHNFTAGAHAKYIHSNISEDSLSIDESFSALAFDVGVIATPDLGNGLPELTDLRIGLTMKNVLSTIFSDNDTENVEYEVPSQLRLSASCFLWEKFQPVIDFRHNGATYGAHYWYRDDMSVRGFLSTASGKSILGMGINKKFNQILLDVSVAHETEMGPAVNLSLKGFWGKEDKCPGEEEDFDGFEDDDGCPDPDNDSDGILDENDECPNEKGPKSNNGCPFVDDDGDGIPNNRDKCPQTPEDKDGFEDEDGCPDLDNDGDGIADDVDKCPNKPETFNGYRDDDGCPDEFFEEWLPIEYETGTSIPTSSTYEKYDGIAFYMLENPELKLEIYAYALTTRLAEERAASLKEYLIAAGVPEENIMAVGKKANKNYLEFKNGSMK